MHNAGPTKAFRYECDYPGVSALLGSNPCGLSSTGEELTEQDLSIYPNPSNGKFDLSGPELSSSDQIEIRDSFGRLVSTHQNGNSFIIENEPNGMYFVSITLDAGRIFRKKVVLAK
jgi:hypothetical protein